MFIKPMIADSREKPFDSSEYLYEPKSNGVRAEIIRTDNDIRVFTRHGKEITNSIPEVNSLKLSKGMILDCELVCYNPENQLEEDFEATLKRILTKRAAQVRRAADKHPCTFIVFDIIMNKNKLTTNFPLIERKLILDKYVDDQDHIKKVPYVKEHGVYFFELIKSYNMEGMVAKQLSSRYMAGKRPKDVWCKIINWRYTDCTITGYRKGTTGWYLSIEENDKFKSVGVVEFGISIVNKSFFYPSVKDIKIGENKNSVFIQPLIKCKIKHRGFLKSGKMMTPVFVEFIV